MDKYEILLDELRRQQQSLLKEARSFDTQAEVYGACASKLESAIDRDKEEALKRKAAVKEDAEIGLEGVCCMYCAMYGQPGCPVKSAQHWSKYKDFCGQYEPNPDMSEARTIQQAVLAGGVKEP